MEMLDEIAFGVRLQPYSECPENRKSNDYYWIKYSSVSFFLIFIGTVLVIHSATGARLFIGSTAHPSNNFKS